MKKIGIITFHRSDNCGSILQAYALQKTLHDKLKYENELIDFSNNNQRRIYSVLGNRSNLKEFLRSIYNLIFIGPLVIHRKDYQLFRDKFLIKGEIDYVSCNDMCDARLKYHSIITGSDQVWNINAADCDKAYYLAFVKGINKIAYAVSFGATNLNDCSVEVKKEYGNLIKDFDNISVRENNAKKWIKELVDREVEVCLDPTFLLEKHEWSNLESESDINEKYIFWYAMTYKKDVANTLCQLSKKTGLPVYVIDAKEWSRRLLFTRGIKLSKSGGPSTFLSLIKNAEIVITSSFHGTVFSSVYEKNFWYINLNPTKTSDDRASGLLEEMNLIDRFVTKEEIVNVDVNQKPNYKNWDEVKKERINESLGYLQRSLNRPVH